MEKQGVEKPIEVRSRVVDLYSRGLSFAETAHNIVKRFVTTESILPGKRVSDQSATKKLTDNVIDYIEYYKTLRPSIHGREIRQICSKTVYVRQQLSPDVHQSIMRFGNTYT